MNKEISYSVAIRTIGKAGEKYIKLLDSIAQQTIQPQKIIVVLPIGAKAPEKHLGTEIFVYSPKGMITQRLYALEYIESDFILFCDDDVEFPSGFVQNLLTTAVDANMDCLAGPLLSFFPPRNIKYFFASVLGGACVMLHNRKHKYVHLLKSGGWSYNWSIDITTHKVYDTDSFPWTCFMIKTKAIKNISFEDELWAEKTGYAAFDDQIFCAKLKLNGFKSCIVSDAHYIHNDAKTSTLEKNYIPIYARSYNRRIYWHRFIYNMSKNYISKMIASLCFYYSYTR